MAFLNRQDNKETLTTPINNIFIDTYMLKANAIFVKVYLYGYRNCYHGVYELTSKQIADALDILESDVILSWKYWEEKELMKLHSNAETGIYDVEYLPIGTQATSEIKPKNKQSPYTSIAVKPQYSPQEISIYRDNNDEIKELFSYTQKTLNKLLTYNDMNIIFSFYDWLRLPINVIKLLFTYYPDKNIRYIEKVAIEWADNEINTVDKVEERMQMYSEFGTIMKALCVTDRTFRREEEEYMKRWLKEYKFPMNIIDEACKRTILNVGKINFKYTQSILSCWYKNNVKNIEDIAELDKAYLEKKKLEAENRLQKKKNNVTAKQNKFINYKQRHWDFDELEKLDAEYLIKNLER